MDLIYERLGMRPEGTFHTIAELALTQLSHLPEAGETFSYQSWDFEIVAMDDRRIAKSLARRQSTS